MSVRTAACYSLRRPGWRQAPHNPAAGQSNGRSRTRFIGWKAGRLAGRTQNRYTSGCRTDQECQQNQGFCTWRPVLSWAPFLLKPMISLKCGLVDPLTGTQTRDTATVTYRMAPLYKDSDSSLWNFRTRTTFIARLIKGCRVDVRAGCLISKITQHFQRSSEHFSRPDAFTGVFVLQP